MTHQDIEYYESRLRVEQRAAQAATHPDAARSHARLAEVYAGLLRGADRRHPLN